MVTVIVILHIVNITQIGYTYTRTRNSAELYASPNPALTMKKATLSV